MITQSAGNPKDAVRVGRRAGIVEPHRRTNGITIVGMNSRVARVVTSSGHISGHVERMTPGSDLLPRGLEETTFTWDTRQHQTRSDESFVAKRFNVSRGRFVPIGEFSRLQDAVTALGDP